MVIITHEQNIIFNKVHSCRRHYAWSDHYLRASEKEKELAKALNEVKCLHVDTKTEGSVAEWLGLRLLSVVPSSGPRPRFKRS